MATFEGYTVAGQNFGKTLDRSEKALFNQFPTLLCWRAVGYSAECYAYKAACQRQERLFLGQHAVYKAASILY